MSSRYEAVVIVNLQEKKRKINQRRRYQPVNRSAYTISENNISSGVKMQRSSRTEGPYFISIKRLL